MELLHNNLNFENCGYILYLLDMSLDCPADFHAILHLSSLHWHAMQWCVLFFQFMQLEIPKILFDQNVFNAWMVLFLNVLERPVPLEGQPVDPDLRKSWGWWKVKKWTIHILNRLYTRCVSIVHSFYQNIWSFLLSDWLIHNFIGV